MPLPLPSSSSPILLSKYTAVLLLLSHVPLSLVRVLLSVLFCCRSPSPTASLSFFFFIALHIIFSPLFCVGTINGIERKFDSLVSFPFYLHSRCRLVSGTSITNIKWCKKTNIFQRRSQRMYKHRSRFYLEFLHFSSANFVFNSFDQCVQKKEFRLDH